MPQNGAPFDANEPYTRTSLEQKPTGWLRAALALKLGTPANRKVVRDVLAQREQAARKAERERTGQPAHAGKKSKKRRGGKARGAHERGRGRGRRGKPRRGDGKHGNDDGNGGRSGR